MRLQLFFVLALCLTFEYFVFFHGSQFTAFPLAGITALLAAAGCIVAAVVAIVSLAWIHRQESKPVATERDGHVGSSVTGIGSERASDLEISRKRPVSLQ